MRNSSQILAEYTPILWIILLFFIAWIFYRFANRELFRWHTYITVSIAYFCAFALIILIPVDIALTVTSRRIVENKDEFLETSDKILAMYRSLFWPGLLLGSLLLVWQEHYNQDGHFSAFSRFMGATKRLVKTWLMMGTVGLIFFLSLFLSGALKTSSSAVEVTLIVMNNTAGLIALCVLLGYGLIEFPKELWRHGDLERRLLVTQMKAATEFKQLTDENLKITLTVADVYKTYKEVQKMTGTKEGDELSRCMQIVMQDCPAEFQRETSIGSAVKDAKTGKITVECLAELRRRLNMEKLSYKICQAKTVCTKKLAYFLEDIQNGRNRPDGIKKIKWSFGVDESNERSWYWHCVVQPALLRVTAAVCLMLSVFVVLGIFGYMAGYNSGLSIFSSAIHSGTANSAELIIFTMMTEFYVVYTCLWAVFKMRIANMMDMVPGGQTTPKSLSFNARQVSRFAGPLVFFYLGLTFESGVYSGSWMEDKDGEILRAAFATFYGNMEVVPFLGRNFNVFCPIVILGVGLFQSLNLFNRLLVKLKQEKFQFGDITPTEDQLKEGQKQLDRYRKQMERSVAREQHKERLAKLQHKNYFAEMFGRGSGQDALAAGGYDDEAGSGFKPLEPEVKSGWIQKKGAASRWESRFFEVKSPGLLVYYKHDRNDSQAKPDAFDASKTTTTTGTAASHGEPSASFELRLAVSIKKHTKEAGSTMSKLISTDDGDDGTRLDIDMPDAKLKLKCETIEDANEWIRVLNKWREWSQMRSRDSQAPLITSPEEKKAANDKSSVPGKSPSKPTSAGDSMNLDDIVIDDDDDLESGHESTVVSPLVKQAVSSARSEPDKPTSVRRRDDDAGKSTAPRGIQLTQLNTRTGSLHRRPADLSGILYKKASSSAILHPWQSRYYAVDPNSMSLKYWHSREDGPDNGRDRKPASDELDLRLIEVKGYVPEPGAKTTELDNLRFNIDVGTRVMKLRAENQIEVSRWMDGLNEWKEYALMNNNSSLKK